MMKAASIFGVAVVALLVVLVATQGERSRRSWEALISTEGGTEQVTFRARSDEVFRGAWTSADLDDLERIDGVEHVMWAGPYALSQAPTARYVLPVRTASPGYLSRRGARVIAGRDLSDADGGMPRVVLSAEQARALFGSDDVGDVVGQSVAIGRESHAVVGVVDAADASYRAARRPAEPASGRHEPIVDVFLMVASAAKLPSVVEAVNAWLHGRANLEGLEAVPIAEFLRPSVELERVDFVRELRQLLAGLVALTLALACVNLVNHTILVAADRQGHWALHRVLGASRRRLARGVVFSELLGHMLAGIVGVTLGYLVARVGGPLSAAPAVVGIGVVAATLIMGSAPILHRVWQPHPYRALCTSRGVVRTGWLGASSAGGLVLSLVIIVLAGGFEGAGQRSLQAEIDAIGPGLAQLAPDRSSLRTVARLDADDADALALRFPALRYTFVERQPGRIAFEGSHVESTLYVADAGFQSVSGTMLREGSWSSDGVVLGVEIAREVFGDSSPVGRTIRLDSIRTGQLDIRVSGVAESPTTARLESLQLPPQATFVPRRLVPSAPIPSTLYLDVRTLGHEPLQSPAELLNERHADSAPFTVQYMSQTFRTYVGYLAAESRRFTIVAALLLVLQGVGLAILTLIHSNARAYRLGLERVFGASTSALLRSEICRHIILQGAVVAFGLVAGVAVLGAWSVGVSYPFVVPYVWLAASAALGLFTGLPIAVATARHAAGRPPMDTLRRDL